MLLASNSFLGQSTQEVRSDSLPKGPVVASGEAPATEAPDRGDPRGPGGTGGNQVAPLESFSRFGEPEFYTWQSLFRRKERG